MPIFDITVPFQDIRKSMSNALKDPGLRQAYIANVAMLLNDKYGITDPEIRNRAAEEILQLIFDS